MNIKALLLCLIALVLVLPGCVRQQPSADPLSHSGAVIAVGKGGGFSGTVREYRLLDSGEVFVKEPGAEGFQFVKRENRKKTKNWFHRLEEIGFRKLDYDHPGNVYQYILLKKGNSENKVMWSGGDKNLPSGVADFYTELMGEWIGDKKK